MTTEADRWRESWERIPPEHWARLDLYHAWKRTPRGRLATLLYPFWHRGYLYFARRDGWA